MAEAPEPTPIAVAVVLRGDQVLIGSRPKGTPLEGLWEFPGGKVRPGELPSEAAVRECWEETGLAVRTGRLLAEIEHVYPHGRVRLWFFEAEPIDPGQPPHAGFRWVSFGELAQYSFPEANQAVVRELIQKGTPGKMAPGFGKPNTS